MKSTNAWMIALLIAASQAHPQDAPEMVHGKPTDPTALITRHGKDMQASHVKVEHVVDGTVLICFRKQKFDNPLVDCFVVNDFTGDTKLVELAVDETIV